MKNQAVKTKLVLRRQTIRRLSADNLTIVHGGLVPAETHNGGCETWDACTLTSNSADCTRLETLCL